MKKAIVVGSGAGGATAAKELQGAFDVTVLEAGNEFRPLSINLKIPERLKRAGLLFDEREIQLIFPAMRVQKMQDRMIHIRGIGTGGTTPLATGNALRMDHDLKKIGIHLDAEFEELSRDIPISTAHQSKWRETTRRLFEICLDMELSPWPTPKMANPDLCTGCGRCILGCLSGAKWDSRQYLREALTKGAKLITGCTVDEIVIQNGKASGAYGKTGRRRKFFPADLVVLAAGGLGTPVILQDSGIACEPRLFVDPVLCVATKWPAAFQNKEIPMPFVVQKEHYIVSPYFDFLSYFFNRRWKAPPQDILSLMIKLADSNSGSVSGGTIHKGLTSQDQDRLRGAVDLCTEILGRLGVRQEDIFLGTINAGHPGGMLPLTDQEATTFHSPRLPQNLYVADASLFPSSLGNPPILTIMALAKRVSRAAKIAHS
jgi:choline dehydrogenase-like flavoprotein